MNDDDRIYIICSDWLTKSVRREDDLATFKQEIVPTDDPNKYVMRITAPFPEFYIKSADMTKEV